jgi:hypothetical protein
MQRIARIVAGRGTPAATAMPKDSMIATWGLWWFTPLAGGRRDTLLCRICPTNGRLISMRPWHVAGALAAMTALAPGIATAAVQDGPAAEDDTSRFESATVVSGLSVIVERSDQRLVAGHDTDYTIGVSNRGKNTQELQIRVTVPPWMPEVNPHDGGELGNGYVEWPVTVSPGEVTILRMTGAYASPDRETPTRVAFTACAHGGPDGQPIVCATDIAQLESGRSGVRGWLVAAVAVALAAAAGAAFRWYRRYRSHPTADLAVAGAEPAAGAGAEGEGEGEAKGEGEGESGERAAGGLDGGAEVAAGDQGAGGLDDRSQEEVGAGLAGEAGHGGDRGAAGG